MRNIIACDTTKLEVTMPDFNVGLPSTPQASQLQPRDTPKTPAPPASKRTREQNVQISTSTTTGLGGAPYGATPRACKVEPPVGSLRSL